MFNAWDCFKILSNKMAYSVHVVAVLHVFHAFSLNIVGGNGLLTVTVKSPVTTNATDNITLPCSYTITGTHQPIQSEIITWEKQDPSNPELFTKIYEWHKITGQREAAPEFNKTTDVISPANLIIYNISGEARGVYRCRVDIIPVGAGQKCTVLEVNERPDMPFFVLDSSNISITAGRMHSVTCQANGGSPLANLTLFRAGHKLTSSDGAVHIHNSSSGYAAVIYSWKPTSADDKATLRCKAVSEIFGEYTPDITDTLNVMYPAEFTNGEPPHTHFVKERDNAVIECTATGNPNVIIYTWKKDGINVKSFGQNFTVSSNGTLIIHDTHYSHSGDYTCEISNGIKPSREKVTNVIIKYLRVLVSSPKEVDENHNITLVCNASGTPTITYNEWNFQGKALPYATQGQQLHLKDVKYTDAGTYTCSASNGDFTKSASSNILVRYAPRQDPKIEHCFKHGADIGDNVTFNFSVIAYPPPTEYQWIKEGNSLNTSLGYFNTTYTLRNITENDFGNYACEVRNDVGMARFTFLLTRKGKPDIPLNLSLVNKSSVSITVQWKPNFNGGFPQTFSLEYVTTGHSTLVDGITDPDYGRLVQKKLDSLDADTEYSVRVQAINGFRGRAESGYTEALFVKTLGKPDIIKNDLEIEITDGEVILTWPQIKTNITSIVIIYCDIETNICNSVFVNDTLTRAVKITLSDGYRYSYNLKLYQGDDLIFETSPLIKIKMVQPSDTGTNDTTIIIIVCVTVGVVVLIVIALLIFLKRRRRQLSANAKPNICSMVANDQYNSGIEGITNEAIELDEPDDINPYSTTTSNGLPPSTVQDKSVDINPYAMASDIQHTLSNGAAQSGDHIDDINPYSVTTETKQMTASEEPDDINPYATSAGPGQFSNQKGQRITAMCAKSNDTSPVNLEGLYAQPDKSKKKKNQEKRINNHESPYSEPDKSKKSNDKEKTPANSDNIEALYVQPHKSKKKAKNNKEMPSPDNNIEALYAQPDKKKKKEGIKDKKKDKKAKEDKKAKDHDYVNKPKEKCPDGPYSEITVLDSGDNGVTDNEVNASMEENPYQEVGNKQGAPAAQNVSQDGMTYADLEFSKKPPLPKKPVSRNKAQVIQANAPTEYAAIDFSKKAQPAKPSKKDDK